MSTKASSPQIKSSTTSDEKSNFPTANSDANKETEPTKRRILLVDDDNDILGILTQVLEHGGFEVSHALTGKDGLRMAVEHPPALALLDVGMEGMSGLELAQQLQAETIVPFMFLSKHGEIEIVRQATKFGAVGFLVKPVDPMQIIPSIESALARADDILKLRANETSLTNALLAGRETSTAVGLLMAKNHVDHLQAFEGLREYSRSNRRKIAEVAHDVLEAEKLLTSINQFFSAKKKTK